MIKARSSRLRVAVLAGAVLFGSVLASSGQAAEPDRRATAHRGGAKAVAAAPGPVAKLFRVGHNAGEPTLGLSRDGAIFMTASSGCVTSCLGQPQSLETVAPGGRSVRVSRDKGRTWKDVSPGAAGVSPHVASLDPYILVDKTGDGERIFTMDLYLGCSELSYSDDQGATWITNPAACGEPVNDHQTLFAGKPVSSPLLGYGKILYYCFNHPAFTKCTKSLDGGLTFIPTAQIVAPECSGLNGHGVVDSKGVIYIPLGVCGMPKLAISRDEGNTWQVVQVAPGGADSGPDPSVAVDAKNNLYYLYGDKGLRPTLVTSVNGGKSWSKPVDVGAPGVKQANLATITVGAPGKVAFAYYGTTSDAAKGAWNGYLGMGIDVLGKNPLFYSASVNKPANPLKVNGCGPGRCGRVLDFIDVEIGPDGAPYAVYVDACLATCEKSKKESFADNDGLLGTLVGGPRLNR